MTETTRTVDHPAQFSPEVIDALRTILPRGAHLHDPFAGPGTRLGALADELYCSFSGTEIEPSFIVDSRVVPGDATDPTTYPGGGIAWPSQRYIIVTSPAYPNGVSDSWKAKDPSRRYTYRSAVAANEGADRELHINNMGRYGYRGTKAGSSKRVTYWSLADCAVSCWGGATVAVVNVSDFISDSTVEPVVDGWTALLRDHDFPMVTATPVKTRRMGDGANRNQRVDHEVILVGHRW